MDFQFLRSLALCNILFVFIAKSSAIGGNVICLCLTLAFFPITFPVMMMFSNSLLLIACPLNVLCLFLIAHIVIFVFVTWSTSSLLTCRTQDVFNICLRNYLSLGSIRFLIVEDSAQRSESYARMRVT